MLFLNIKNNIQGFTYFIAFTYIRENMSSEKTCKFSIRDLNSSYTSLLLFLSKQIPSKAIGGN